MKKAFVLALAVILALSLAVPAAAAGTGSPVAPETSETTTAPLPEIVETEVKTEDGITVVVEPVAAEDTKALAVEEQKTFATAQESLAEAVPTGMKPQYFFYVKVTATKADGSVSDKPAAPVNMTVKIDNAAKVVVKQFIDGKWVERKVVVNPDGTITIEGVVEGPIAIFTE